MASRSFLESLKKDQILSAKVEEVTSLEEALVNFHGELLLIRNNTGKVLQVGDVIALQVQSTRPLKFEIFKSQSSKFQRVV